MFNDPIVFYATAKLSRLLVEGVFSETVCRLNYFCLSLALD